MLKKVFSFLIMTIVLIGLTSCSNYFEKQPSPKNKFVRSDKVTMTESAILVENFVDQESKPFYGYFGYGYQSEEDQKGVIFDRVPERRARRAFQALHVKLEKKGFFIFLSNVDFEFDESDDWSLTESYYDVIVMKAKDKYEVVKEIGTGGMNYDITNEMVIAKLKEWEENFAPFTLIEISWDGLEAELKRPVKNPGLFAQEIFDFSPDTVWQGTDTIDALVKEIEEDEAFWLWWD